MDSPIPTGSETDSPKAKAGKSKESTVKRVGRRRSLPSHETHEEIEHQSMSPKKGSAKKPVKAPEAKKSSRRQPKEAAKTLNKSISPSKALSEADTDLSPIAKKRSPPTKTVATSPTSPTSTSSATKRTSRTKGMTVTSPVQKNHKSANREAKSCHCVTVYGK